MIKQLIKTNMSNMSNMCLFRFSREKYRRISFGDMFDEIKDKLVQAGFYFTGHDQIVRCFACLYEFDIGEVDASEDFVKFHMEKKPECTFILHYQKEKDYSKKFLTYDSLRYERERLKTFIEWPVPWILPEDLAADGFYYLRTHDHCACVFCRGIVGAWEVGDTPRGEHIRHFPHCPFLRSVPVGNVSMNHSKILDKLVLDGEEYPLPQPRKNPDNPQDPTQDPNNSQDSNNHPQDPNNLQDPQLENLNDIGLRPYSGPKRRDYITCDSRIKSFDKWPERVIQSPKDMAEAGFFYCGLSDHVRCFHCGNGLRNWTDEDNPWEEHARWYPDCNYVFLTKGHEYIENIKFRYRNQQKNKSSGCFNSISENDLDVLMESDIVKEVEAMGFPTMKIRTIFKQKLEQTGIPFFNLDSCIELVLKDMKEETTENVTENVDIAENVNIAENVSDVGCSRNQNTAQTMQIPEVDITQDLDRNCKICMDSEFEVIFLPCKHMVTCSKCAVTMMKCPICRNDIRYTIKPIIS